MARSTALAAPMIVTERYGFWEGAKITRARPVCRRLVVTSRPNRLANRNMGYWRFTLLGFVMTF